MLKVIGVENRFGVPNNLILLNFGVPDNQILLQLGVPDNQFLLHFDVLAKAGAWHRVSLLKLRNTGAPSTK